MKYQSPYSNRYGSQSMRALWSEVAKRRCWRRVWLAVAQAQAEAGLVSSEKIAQIRSHAREIDLPRALEIEAEIGHDLMAELKTFAEQCPSAGGILHWGLTSADVQDNADVLRQRMGLTILLGALRNLLLGFADQILATADIPLMGYTHLQPAEPTSLGYRLSNYAQDLLALFDALARLRRSLKGKGIKGAVGTSAAFVEMLAQSPLAPEEFEAKVMQRLGLEAFPIAAQTYPRLQDYRLLSALATLAACLHRFAFDLRLMQSPGFRAASEPFGERQVGSSAMPFKQNPVTAEKICSLARQVAAYSQVAWQNAAATLLERTLDDSANRRSIIPEAFLACDEMLYSAKKIMDGLEIDRQAIARQMESYGPFAATERVLTALVGKGADRHDMHERLRRHSLRAWQAVQSGHPNPLEDLLATDTSLLKYLQPARVHQLMDARRYLGLAPQRARRLAAEIKKRLANSTQGAEA